MGSEKVRTHSPSLADPALSCGLVSKPPWSQVMDSTVLCCLLAGYFASPTNLSERVSGPALPLPHVPVNTTNASWASPLPADPSAAPAQPPQAPNVGLAWTAFRRVAQPVARFARALGTGTFPALERWAGAWSVEATGWLLAMWRTATMLTSRLKRASRSLALRLRGALALAASRSLQAVITAIRRWRDWAVAAPRRAVRAVAKAARRRRDVLSAAVGRRWDELGSMPSRAASEWRRFRARDRAVSRILRSSASGRWYEVLQVRRRASKRACKDAYRRLAKRVHPDKTRDPRASAAFDALRDTYELLVDERRRSKYDEEIARADRLAQQRRQHRRAVALRVVRRAALSALRTMWVYRRSTLPFVAVLALVLRARWLAWDNAQDELI